MCGGIFSLMFVFLVILFSMGEIGDFLNKSDIILKIFSNNRCNRSTDYNVNPSDIVLSMGDDYMFAISMQEVNFSESPSYNVTF